MSKPETISETKPEGKISVCDIMKTNTSKVIQKFESKIPPRFQQYSDLYAAYLHTIDDLYGTCGGFIVPIVIVVCAACVASLAVIV